MSDIRTFGVKSADEYWQKRQEIKSTSERRLHRFLADCIGRQAGQGGAVLDCGMGSGHVFRLCHERGGQTMYGVEMSSHIIDGYPFPTDNIRQADLNEGLPDFGVAFDVISASMLLHWLDDPSGFLRQAAGMLSSSGCLLIVIPNITYYRYRIGYLFGKFPPISLSHKNFQTPTEFEAMAEECDLEIFQKMSPKAKWRAKHWPNLFSQDIVYVLRPRK